MKLVIVTGLSGSGKSVALHTLEDLGYYCIDNLPMFLLVALAEDLVERRQTQRDRIAVGIDARTGSEGLSQLPSLVRNLRRQSVECEILFLEARDEILLRRFSETRRRHPLTDADANLTLDDAIRRERELMSALLTAADLRIDTTRTTQHELRDLIRSRLDERPRGKMALLFESFGFKHGVPRDVDFVFDVRCLANPHWDPVLRPLTGRDEAVACFLEQDPKAQRMREEIISFLERWIPSFEEDGRSYLTVAFGCTGGQHRSVYMAEQAAAHFRRLQYKAPVRHRELP